MYGTFTYIYHKNQLNVDKYTIHGWYGYVRKPWMIRVNDFSFFGFFGPFPTNPKAQREQESRTAEAQLFQDHVPQIWAQKKKNIGVVWLGTEEKCTKRGTPRYKTVMKSMAGINCVSNSKARETPPCSHILRKYACSMPLKLGKQQGKLAVEM